MLTVLCDQFSDRKCQSRYRLELENISRGIPTDLFQAISTECEPHAHTMYFNVNVSEA